MNISSKIFISTILLTTILLSSPSLLKAADDVFRLEFDYNSRSTIDSTRRDWYEYVYDTATTTVGIAKRQYDESFIGTHNDLYIAINGDLNETCFLDIKESLNYRYYNDQEPLGRDYSSFKYRDLDHHLNMTLGIAAGVRDYFQLDYHNTYLDIPDLDIYSFSSNRGSAMFCHEFSERTSMTVTGNIEERQFENDSSFDYKEALGRFEVATLIPGRYEYKQIANSIRGDKTYFENFPSAMSAKKAIKYYTDYVRDPRDSDPNAKYMSKRARGDLFLKVFADIGGRDLSNLDNDYEMVSGGMETAYSSTDELILRLRNSYSKINYKHESEANFLHDHTANHLTLSADYAYSSELFQTLTFNNEIQKNSVEKNEDFTTNSLAYESWYSAGNTLLSLSIGYLKRAYEQKRDLYPDEKETHATFGYDYSITPSICLKLRTEFVDCEYTDFEDSLYSSYIRKTWRVGVEKSLSKYNALELAFQVNNEKHDVFTENNLEEKSLHCSWNIQY